MTHAAVPLAAALALGPSRIPPHIVAVGVVLAMLPDADVVGFRLGIDYADVLGHRGASHAISVGVGAAALVMLLLRRAWPRAVVNGALVFGFLALSMVSHGLLDALTSGGLGPALFWPVDDARHFAPWRPIRVSPIGMGFFSMRGLVTLASEALWVWLPALLAALSLRAILPHPGRSGATR